MKAYVVVLLGLSTVVCAAQDLRSTPAAKQACGSFADFDSPIQGVAADAPKSDKDSATVYIIQISNVIGHCLGNCGPKSHVAIDGKWVGPEKGSSFIAVSVPPGLHHVCAALDSRNKHLAQLVALHSVQAEPGRSYYFRLELLDSGTLYWAQYSLEPLDADEGQMLIAAYPGRHVTK